jgi:hypothetical protein
MYEYNTRRIKVGEWKNEPLEVYLKKGSFRLRLVSVWLCTATSAAW